MHYQYSPNPSPDLRNPTLLTSDPPDICGIARYLWYRARYLWKITTPYTSRFAFFAWLSINLFLGATSSPISMLKVLSASTASSIFTFNIVLLDGSIVVSQSVSGFISPRRL